MNKFYNQIFKDIQYGVRYRYAPETFYVKYKGEDITDLITDLSFGGQEYLKGNHKKIQDSIKRGIRKNSKLSNKNKKLRLCVVLDDNTYLHTDSFLLVDRFGDMNSKLKEYKYLKEHINSAYTETATLNENYKPCNITKELLYDKKSITGITYL